MRPVAEPRRAPIPILGRLLEPFYGAAIARRNAGFDAGRGVQTFFDKDRYTIPVISIGNLSVGGTGKTPMVMHVLHLLLEHGHSPCVAMRGYSKPGSDAPDETDAYRRAFPNVPVVAQPDRAAGLRELLSKSPSQLCPECIVLDDGFQHRQIGRNWDVVLIDATPGRSVFDDRLLPAGWLREPVQALRRASAIVLSHAELASPQHLQSLTTAVRCHSNALVAVTRHVWTGLKQRVGSDDRMLPLDALIGRRITGCCAIGHPGAFFRSLAAISGTPEPALRATSLALADHDPYRPATIARLVAAAKQHNSEFIVVTDKDWSKLRTLPDSTWPCPIVRPELAIVFDSGREEFDRWVLGAIGGVGNAARVT